MGFFIPFLISLAISVVVGIGMFMLMPKPQTAKPPSISAKKFEVPTAEEGREIPVLFGTRMIAGPNVTWWGDVESIKYEIDA